MAARPELAQTPRCGWSANLKAVAHLDLFFPSIIPTEGAPSLTFFVKGGTETLASTWSAHAMCHGAA
jgi:hypothetical protein